MVHKKERSSSLGTALVVLSSFFYASYGIWTKLMGDFFDGYVASALRSVIVVVILLAVAVYYRRLEPLELKKNWSYIVGMLVASLFIWGPYYFAVLQAGVGVSLTINYASIVIGMFFFGWLFAGEHFTSTKCISAILGIIGLAFVFSPTLSSFAWLALGAAVLSGLATAANTIFAKKIHYSSTQATLAMWVTSIISNMFMAFVLGKSYPQMNGQIQWFYLVLFAIASVVASWCLVRGVKLIDAGIAGILGLFEIVFGVVFGIVLFHEQPTLVALIGVAIIIVAAAVPSYATLKKKNRN